VVYETPSSGEISSRANVYSYELVYMLDAKHKRAFIFGQKDCGGKDPGGAVLYAPMHEKYHDAALAGREVSYEWAAGGKSYRSTLIPLVDGKGAVTNVLGLVKDISAFTVPANIVRDVGTKTFSQILIKAREEEKKKFAGAMHDEIGTMAVVLTSILSVLESDVNENKKPAALRRAVELKAKIKESVERMKNLIVTMRPPNIDTAGLDGAVKEMVEGLNRISGASIKYKYVEEDDGFIDGEVKIMLYRVVQESLTNALKHSCAQNINVTLQNLKNLVKIEVSDDGRGFRPAGKQTLGHLGLPGMEESVKYLGGQFKIKTALGRGTVVQVSCPKVIYKVGI